MKKSISALLVVLVAFLFSCNNDDYNYQTMIEVNYNPVRLDDSLVFSLKKLAVNNLRIDSLRIGDTLSVKVKLFDLKYDLKSVRFVTDSTTMFLLSDDKAFRDAFKSNSDFTKGELSFKSGVKTQYVELKYITLKSGKNSALRVFLTTQNSDSLNCCDSLRLNTPVKFLP